MSKTTAERFWSKVDKTESCWNWIAGKDSKGYGSFWLAPTMRVAHRISYEMARGDIPIGLELDHLCRNRGCVNPDHLEPVTHYVNVLRAPLAVGTLNSAKTHCPAGHEYTPENTSFGGRGGRVCKECKRAQSRRDYWAART